MLLPLYYTARFPHRSNVPSMARFSLRLPSMADDAVGLAKATYTKLIKRNLRHTFPLTPGGPHCKYYKLNLRAPRVS